MKLLLDQGLPRSAAALLREDNIDAIHTGEIGYETASDSHIIAYAQSDGRIVVTLDSDFHALLAQTNAASPSIIRIRIERLKGDACAKLIQKLLNDWAEELNLGVLLTVLPGRVRTHRLPIFP